MSPRRRVGILSFALCGTLALFAAMRFPAPVLANQSGGYCGDGIIQTGEECDAGIYNGLPDSLCMEDCTLRYLSCFAPACGCFRTGQEASLRLGQTSFVTSTYGIWQGALRRPTDVAINPKHHLLYIADRDNNRVIVHRLDAYNKVVGSMANGVIGQNDFETSATNVFQAPRALALDIQGNRVFIAHQGGIVVLDNVAPTPKNGFELLSFDAYASIENPSGAPPRGLAYSRRGFLYTAYPDGVRRYDVRSGVQNGTPPPSVLVASYQEGGSPRTLSPWDVLYDPTSEEVYVADGTSRRVLVFSEHDIGGEGVPSPVHAYGTSGVSLPSAESIGMPEGLAFHNDTLFVSDRLHHRVMVFAKGTHAASAILGQNDAFSIGNGTSSTTLHAPVGLASLAETCQLFVADSENHRVLVYDAPSCTAPPAVSIEPEIKSIASILPDTVIVVLNVDFVENIDPSDIVFQGETPSGNNVPEVESIERYDNSPAIVRIRLNSGQQSLVPGATYTLTIRKDAFTFEGMPNDQDDLEENFETADASAPGGGAECEMRVINGVSVCCPLECDAQSNCLCCDSCQAGKMCASDPFGSWMCTEDDPDNESDAPPPPDEGDTLGDLPPPIVPGTGGGSDFMPQPGWEDYEDPNLSTEIQCNQERFEQTQEGVLCGPDVQGGPDGCVGMLSHCRPSPADNPSTCACSSCPYFQLWDGNQWVYQQNMLKGNAMKSLEKPTFERVRTEPQGDELRIRIRESGYDRTYLDAVSLVQINHANGTHAYLDYMGRAWDFGEEQGVSRAPSWEHAGGRDIVEIDNLPKHGALLITGGIDLNHFGALREAAFGEARMQCVPGVYALLDNLPRRQASRLARNVGGIEIWLLKDGTWSSVNDGTLILEKEEDLFIPLEGATAVRLSVPEGAYRFSRFEALEHVRTAQEVLHVSVAHPELRDADGTYVVITEDTPLELAIPLLPSAGRRTAYLRSSGYYHYEAMAECASPSYRYDVILRYLSKAR